MGPPKCGKTSLLTKYMTGKCFSEEMIENDRTINYNVNLIYRSQNLTLEELNDKKNWNFSIKLVDYNLTEENTNNKNELCDIDGIIMCFDVTSKASFELLESFYRNYINTRWPFVPKILVGCLSDLLKVDSENMDFSIDGIHAIVCTALENLNIDNVFLRIFKKSAEKLRIDQENLRKHELEIFESDFLNTDLLIKPQKGELKKKIREIPIHHIKNDEIVSKKRYNADAFIRCKKVNAEKLSGAEKLFNHEKSRCKEENRFIEKMTQTSSNNENKLKYFNSCGLIFLAVMLFLFLASCCCEVKVKDTCFSIYHGSKAFLNESIDTFSELILNAADFSNNYL